MQQILDFLNNPVVLTVALFLFGLLVKRWPGLKDLPEHVAEFIRQLIPWCNAILAFLVKLGGGGAALHPASAVDAMLMPAAAVYAAGFGGSLGALIFDSFWQSLLTSLLHDKFGQPVLERPRPPAPATSGVRPPGVR